MDKRLKLETDKRACHHVLTWTMMFSQRHGVVRSYLVAHYPVWIPQWWAPSRYHRVQAEGWRGGRTEETAYLVRLMSLCEPDVAVVVATVAITP